MSACLAEVGWQVPKVVRVPLRAAWVLPLEAVSTVTFEILGCVPVSRATYLPGVPGRDLTHPFLDLLWVLLPRRISFLRR